MGKSIGQITREITDFADERGWNHESPTHLIVALMGELGELTEHYQWQDEFAQWSDDKKREVGYEFVDVIFYLFRLASRSGIDIEKYFDEKLPKLAQKYPADATSAEHRRSKAEYRRTGRNRLYE